MTPPVAPPSPHPAERQRLDKWLWFARVVKTRSQAARLVSEGHVRVNAVKVDLPAKAVKVGDVLTVALDRRVRVLKILGAGVRRGPYEEAKTLLADLTEGDGGPDRETEADQPD